MAGKARSLISDIHVIVDLKGRRSALRVAVDVARRMNAHLSGLSLAFEPLVPVYPMAAPIPTEFMLAARDAAEKEAKTSANAFAEIAKSAGVAFDSRAIATIIGEGFEDAVEACRLSDLVVVGQADPEHPEPMRNALLEALLFDAAAPTLLVPYAGVDAFESERAIVAWDGSAQASRALRAALPLLAQTRTVTVVIVSEAEKWLGGVPGADVADHLARHGVSVNVERLDNPLRDVAATLLNAVADRRADWLVMGAYGHSRARQLFLGGVTRTVLASATVPVLMVH